MKDSLAFIRVSYGKDDIRLEDREYRLDGIGPVGCASEIKSEFSGKGFDKAILWNKDCTKIEQEVSLNG